MHLLSCLVFPGLAFLKLEAPVPDGFRECLDPAMVLESAPVKGNRLYLLRSSALGQEFSNLLCRINISTLPVS